MAIPRKLVLPSYGRSQARDCSAVIIPLVLYLVWHPVLWQPCQAPPRDMIASQRTLVPDGVVSRPHL